MGNPNPGRITDAMWWLWEQLFALDPADTDLGGIFANKPGYHNTRANNSSTDYSVRDAIDKQGPSDKAAAIDWTFRSAQAGNYANINKYFSRFMTAARARDPRLFGWREGQGNEDVDKTAEGWDIRYHRSENPSGTHAWHCHFSEDRAYVESLDNKKALLSVLKGETLEQFLAAGGVLIDGATVPSGPGPLPSYTLGSRVLRKDMRGTDVAEAQRLLTSRGFATSADGDFGAKTDAAVKAFQKARWLDADGEVGPDTLASLRTNIGYRVMKKGHKGSDVGELQRLLTRRGYGLSQDGDFGSKTLAAVKAYQKASRLGVDGEAGPKTVGALRK